MICPAMKIYYFLVLSIFALAAIIAFSCEIFSQSERCKEASYCDAKDESSRSKMSSISELELELWTKNNWRY